MPVFGGRGIARLMGALLLVGLAAGGLSAPAAAQPAASAPVQWLCSPETDTDPCDLPDDTTDLLTGEVTPATPVSESDKPVDCFYVYPTVSDQVALNADLTPQPEVQSIASFQAARFGSQCRIFAPTYRQMTLTPGIGGYLAGAAPLAQTAYGDVLAAWNDYLANDNDGRGVIFIGHSQGTMMLRKLIREQIDPNPALRDKLVGAFLMGANVETAPGSATGGDFQNIPLCTEPGEAGCVVAYSTAVADPTASLFGNSAIDILSPGMGLPSGPQYQVACTDPAALSGNSEPVGLTVPSAPFAFGIISVLLDYTAFPKGSPTSTSTWTTSAERAVGSCTDVNGYRTYQFRITDPRGQRVNELPLFGGHLVDINLGYDRLVSIAEQQTREYLLTSGG